MNPPRITDAVTYLSPSFSGFTFAAQYAKNDAEADFSDAFAPATNTRADVNTTHWGVNAIYANGPLSVGVTYWDAETDTATDTAATALTKGSTMNINQRNVAGSYDFGVAKVWGLYVAGDNDTSLIGALNADESDGWELGLSVPMGAWKFWGSYAQADRSVSANPAVGVARVKEKLDYDAWQLGATYSMSKRTTAYLQYGDVEIDDKVKAIAFKESANADQFSVGLRHVF